MSGKNSAAQFKDTYGARSTFTGGMLDPFGVGIVGLSPKHPMFRKDLDVPLEDWTADLWDQARLTQAEKDPVPPDAILAIGGPRHAIKVTNRRGLVLCVDGRRTIIGCRLAVTKQKAAKADPAEYIELIAIVDKSKDLDVSVRLANSGRRDDPPWVKAANALYLDGRKKPHTVIMAALDNCDRHTLNNYLAYGNAVPEIKAQVEDDTLPKSQRVPFMVAVIIAGLGEGETKRQLLALAYMRAAGLQLTGEQGRTNATQVVKAIQEGKVTDKSLATIQKDPPRIPAAAPSSPASASSPSPATSAPTAESKPQDKPTTKSRQPREVIPGVVTVRALKPKLIALAQANLEPTGDEPLETEAGRAGLAVLNVITGQDPTGDGLKEFPELAAAFRKVLPSATVTP